jgi:hypothetical protein
MRGLLLILATYLLALPVWAQAFQYKKNRYTLDYKRQGHTQELRFKGSLIVASGEKKSELYSVLENRVLEGLDTRIVLDVFGGDLAVVNRMYDILRSKCHDRGSQQCTITTQVEMFRYCASACIPLFMVGDKRIAAERSSWGFHQAAILGGYVMLPFMSEYVLREKGVNARWLKDNKELFSTLRVTWFEPRELNGSGIVTHIIQHPR